MWKTRENELRSFSERRKKLKFSSFIHICAIIVNKQNHLSLCNRNSKNKLKNFDWNLTFFFFFLLLFALHEAFLIYFQFFSLRTHDKAINFPPVKRIFYYIFFYQTTICAMMLHDDHASSKKVHILFILSSS